MNHASQEEMMQGVNVIGVLEKMGQVRHGAEACEALVRQVPDDQSRAALIEGDADTLARRICGAAEARGLIYTSE